MKPINPTTLTQELIRCASVTPADKGAQDVLKQPLREMGFEIFDLPFEGNGGSFPVKNFFARLDKNMGAGQPHLGYSGHTDVVPAGDEAAWTYPPFEAVIDGGKLYGRGACDMKSANAAFISALSRFLDTYPDFKGSISVMITGDEEAERFNGTTRIIQWAKENNHIPDVVLIGEPTSTQNIGDTIKIGRRGILTGSVTVTGKQGHVAYPHFALNPIPMATKIAMTLDEFVLDEGTENFQPTNLEFVNFNSGLGADNVIPETAIIEFNIRFNILHSFESLKETIENEVHKTVQDTDYDITVHWEDSNSDAFLTPKNKNIDLLASCISSVTGLNKTDLSTGGGSSDAPFIKKYCPVFEFGLVGKTMHQIDEHVSLSDIETLADIYTEFLTQYFKQKLFNTKKLT